MKILDLFAGCGGFSLGFQMENFKSCLAIEIDLWASETYSYNHPKIPVLTKDIRKIDPKKLNLKNIDGIIGGPPCQGFSLSGNRDTKDPRNSLFIDFVRFVKILQPKFFVMENVKVPRESFENGRNSDIIKFVEKLPKKIYSVVEAQYNKNENSDSRRQQFNTPNISYSESTVEED